MPLEKLYGALVGLSFFSRRKGAQIAALAGFGILLAGIETVLAGREFADHNDLDGKRMGSVAIPACAALTYVTKYS
jgi:hypothetical protein